MQRLLPLSVAFGLLLVGIVPVVLCGDDNGRWFNFRLLRNPGLSSVKVSGLSDCFNLCQSNNTCSALSYQPNSGMCVTSSCNILDLFKTNGWNTYVFDTTYIEGKSVLASRFEWMLTDTCGIQNNGVASGPAVSLLSVTYAASLSPKAGNAVKFAGNTNSYAKTTSSDARLNNVMGTTSLSLMMWFNLATVASCTLGEFKAANRGPTFWITPSGTWYDIRASFNTTCSQSCSVVSYPFTPLANTWYHVAFVYDGENGLMQTFRNSSLVATKTVGSVSNTQIWDLFYIGFSPYDQSAPMNGLLYCVKLFDITLNSDQISALADSCSRGKIRFSD